MCLCACVFVHVFACVRACAFNYTCVYVFLNLCACARACECNCALLCVGVRMCPRICVFVCA